MPSSLRDQNAYTPDSITVFVPPHSPRKREGSGPTCGNALELERERAPVDLPQPTHIPPLSNPPPEPDRMDIPQVDNGTHPQRQLTPPSASSVIREVPRVRGEGAEGQTCEEEANRVPSKQEDAESEEHLWKEYLSQTDKSDLATVENWKGDADNMLIFTGLFSGTVGAFLIESYQGLMPDPNDRTNELLSQLVAFSVNGTHLPAIAPAFHASTTSVWVNALWFCSLVLSLLCALGATFVQQWVRTYMQATQDAKAPAYVRGRGRVYVFQGVVRWRMPQVIACIPVLLHGSLLFFFIGLVVFLEPINAVVANIVLGVVAGMGGVYAFFTLLPFFVRDSPFKTPLSPVLWRILHVLLVTIRMVWATLTEPAKMLAKPARNIAQIALGLGKHVSALRECDSPLKSVLHRMRRLTEVTESLSEYHFEARLARVRSEKMEFEEFGALASAIFDIVAGPTEEPHLILDGASAFLRQHDKPHTGEDAASRIDKILEYHFASSRPGKMIHAVVTVSASCREEYRDAFLKFLWELSTRYSYSRNFEPSPTRNVLARVALRTGYHPWRTASSSPNRAVAVTAVCLRAWADYHNLKASPNLSGLYHAITLLLEAVLPYYAEDRDVHRLLYPIVSAYASLLHDTSTPREPEDQHRGPFLAIWDTMDALYYAHLGTPSTQQVVFDRPLSMNAPVKSALSGEPELAMWRELRECLRAFHRRLYPAALEDVREDPTWSSAVPDVDVFAGGGRNTTTHFPDTESNVLDDAYEQAERGPGFSG